jgi:hypothetical protein
VDDSDSKPKTLKDLQKEIPSTHDVMSRPAIISSFIVISGAPASREAFDKAVSTQHI